MLPSHLDILRTLQAQYDGKLVASDTVKLYSNAGDNFITIKTPEIFRILFEGSHDLPNWVDNFEAFMIYPKELGGAGVEMGFWKNLPWLFDQISADLPEGTLISCEGHSRGAAMADQFGALLYQKGYRKIQCVTFGRPNPGDEELAKIHDGIINASYWNYSNWLEHDPVGNVPPHLICPFTQTSPRITVDMPPAANDQWGVPLGWHHLTPNYEQGIIKLSMEANDGNPYTR